MIKRDELVILFVILLAVFSIQVKAFSVNFVSPTPENYASNTSIAINVSSDVVGDSYAFVNWNKTASLWLTMDTNSSGTGLYDKIYGLNCTLTSGANVSQGYWGNASNYDGVDDHANCGDPTNGALDIATEDFSISFWVKPRTAGANGRIIVKGATTATNSPGYLINFVAPNVVSLSISNASTRLAGVSTTTALTLGNWHHVVLVADRDGTAQFYLNGTALGTAGSIAAYSQSLASASSLTIGAQPSSLAFNGSIDDIVLFKRTLSSSEVLALYNYTKNKYDIDYSSKLVSAGDIYNYTAYIVNSSGDVNNSETRQFTFARTLTIVSPQYNNRNYTSVTSLNLTTNFDASCRYTNDSGLNNYSLSSTNNRNFNATVSLAQANYVFDFYCNDSTTTLSSQRNFSIVDHLVWYVDNSTTSCTDTNDRNYATSQSTPFCTILSAMKNVSAGDEVVLLNSSHSYCEPINTQGISGTAGSPIIVRGESDSQRTILNGTCYSTTADAIELDGEDFYTFRYFYITNFSSDALNIHASGTDNSLNITFENMTIHQNGYSGQGVPGGAFGDGVSFHENCTGVGRWINFTGNWKSGIVDINGAQTDYYNLFITDSEDYGVYFLASGYSAAIGKHYLENIVVNNSNAYCLASDVNVTAVNYTCIGNTGNHQFYFGAPSINITNFNISQTSASYSSVYIYGGSNVSLTDGKMDRNVTLISGSRLIALNVSYPAESVDAASNLTRNWYYRTYVKDENGNPIQGVNVTIYNNAGALVKNLTTAADGYTEIYAITDYVNLGGTKTYYSNYNVTIQKTGYAAGSHAYNSTFYQNNLTDSFTMGTNPMTANLVSPRNNTQSNNLTNTFSCNITDLDGISNLTLYIWNSSSSLNYTNTTSLTGTENSTNWTYTLPYEGSWKWNCLGYDSLNNNNWSSHGNYTLVSDVTKSTIGLISPDEAASSASTSTSFSFNVSDSTTTNCSLILDGSAVNFNSSVNISGGTNSFTNSTSVGSHSWSINCTDSAGNSANSSTRTFTITAAAATATEESDSSSSEVIISLNEEELKNGVNKKLYQNGEARFKIKSENHKLKLNKISKNSITITISSVPQTATLSVGEERKFSLNDSEFYDLSVKLNSIKQNYANITLTEINEKVFAQPSTEEPGEPEAAAPAQNEERVDWGLGKYFIIYLILVLVLLAVILAVIFLKRKNRPPRKPNFHHLKR